MASLPLHPESGPRLVGIARLAASGEFLREGHKVEYFTLPVRSLLNRCTVPRMPFTWTINPYRGCEFACKYCYARYTHEFMEMRNGLDFEQKIYVKQHASDLLRQELRQVKRGEEIAIGTATDPYQPAERRFEGFPRSLWTTTRSPSCFMRCSSLRTHRSLTCICSAALRCVICFRWACLSQSNQSLSCCVSAISSWAILPACQ